MHKKAIVLELLLFLESWEEEKTRCNSRKTYILMLIKFLSVFDNLPPPVGEARKACNMLKESTSFRAFGGK